MEKPDQISYLAELQYLSIGEVQENVGDNGTYCQWEEGDPNALRTLARAHGSSLLRKDTGGLGYCSSGSTGFQQFYSLMKEEPIL